MNLEWKKEADKKTKVSRTCSECGREFKSPYGHTMTCGVVCSERRSTRKKRERKSAAGWKPKHRGTLKYAKQCSQCGKDYVSGHKSGKFCSDSCKGKHLRQKRASTTKAIEKIVPQYKEVRPKQVEGHDDDLKREIRRFLRAGGKIKRYTYQEPSTIQEITDTEYSIIQDLAGMP